MSNITAEQKLRLLRQVRSRYNEDQYDLSNRERTLYGVTSVRKPDAASWEMDEAGAEAPGEVSSFRVRLLLALLLFLGFVIMDKNGIKAAGITTEQICQAISADYEEKIDEWAEAFAASYNSPQR